MINFNLENGRNHDHNCALCRIDRGEKAVYGLGTTQNQRILLGLTEDPLVMDKDHGEKSDRREQLYIADQIQPAVFRVYEKLGASGIMLASNYEGAADVKNHPHTHLQPIVRENNKRLELSLEKRGDVLVIVRDLREGIEEILNRK